MKFYIPLLLVITIFFILCANHEQQVLSSFKDHSSPDLDDYWYQGLAEVTSYTLLQNRYQDEHPGHAVMIFVTEDFLLDKQVKNDSYTSSKSTNILKNNRMKRFTTGLYDYSMMTSTFTPVDQKLIPHSLKVTMSSQDWCGQSYQQVNAKGNRYHSILHSYFESEADRNSFEDQVFLEDELFTMLRINPDLLPTGNMEVIPMLEFLRLKHLPFQKMNASGNLGDYSGNEFEGEDLKVYELSYIDIDRKFNIIYENEKPFKIVGWEEIYPSAFDGEIRKTTAKRKQEVLKPYWKLNALRDSLIRKELGL